MQIMSLILCNTSFLSKDILKNTAYVNYLRITQLVSTEIGTLSNTDRLQMESIA